MTPRILTRDQVREVDRRAIEEYGLPGVVLMENAGRGVAEWLAELAGESEPSVAICCGKGNNGGDGFVIARHLNNRGWAVEILLFAEPDEISGDAGINLGVAMQAGYSISPGTAETIRDADWVIDALLGTGTTGAPRPPFDEAIRWVNARGGNRVMAIDVPSGLDCDTGEAAGVAVNASHTATFVARKPGFTNPAATGYLGEVRVIDIGVPTALIDEIAAG